MQITKLNMLARSVVIAGCLFWYALAAAGTIELPLAQALSRVNLFSELTDAERNLLKTAAQLRQGKAGEQIIRQGKAMGRMIVILDGQAEVRIKDQLIASLSGQILLGEIEFLDGLPASADVFLLKDADYLSLDFSILNRLLEAHPRMGYLVIRQIARIEAQRLRNTNAN